MPDPIKDLYNSLKSTKLFLDENDFRQQLNKSPKEVFDIVSKEKQTSGLFIDFDDFENATGLKKKISEKVSEDGGKAGISALPSDSGKGFGELKPAKRQPAEVIKEPKVVGEDTLLARKIAKEQKAAPVSTQVQLPAAPKVIAEERALERAEEPKLPEATKQVGEFEAFSNALERGFKQGQIADMMALGQMPSREDLKEIARLTREQQAIPSSGAYERFNSAPDFSTAAKEFIKNPFEIGSQLIAESLSAQVRHGASRAVAGATTGALAGSVIPGGGTVAGAGYGFMAGMGVAGYNLEMASSILDSFREAGVDITDEKSLQKGFDNPETLRKAREFANKRAVPIALFDMFSAGMGGKLLGKPAKTMLQKVGRGAAEVGIQAGLAGAGEATAQKVSGQKFNPTAIFAEMIGQTGGGAPDIIVGTAIESKKQGKPTIKEVAQLDIKPEELQDMLDVSEATGELTDAQADEIKNEYAKVQEVRSVVPEQYKKNAEVIEALQKKKELEQQKKGLDPVFAKKIDAQIAEQEALIERATTPKEKYRVEYFDPAKGEMTHSYFDSILEGDTFTSTLTDAQKSKGVKAFFELTTEPSLKIEEVVTEIPKAPEVKAEGVGEEAAPQVPAAEIPKEIVELKDDESVVFNVKTIEEIPEEFRDRAVKKEGITAEVRKKILGLPIGKKSNIKLGEGFSYTLTGKEAKEYASKQAAPEVPAAPEEMKPFTEEMANDIDKTLYGTISGSIPLEEALPNGVYVDLGNNLFAYADKNEKIAAIVDKANGYIVSKSFWNPRENKWQLPNQANLRDDAKRLGINEDEYIRKYQDAVDSLNVSGKGAPAPEVKAEVVGKEVAQVPAAPITEEEIKAETEEANKKLEELGKRQVEVKGKGDWRQKFNEEKDAFKKSKILRAIAESSNNIEELNDIRKAAKGMPEEGNIINEVDNKLKSLGQEIKTEEDAIPEPSPEGVLQPEQERIGEEGGERRGVESPVERVAAAQEGKVEAAKKEIAKREKAYAPPEGRQLEVNKLVGELYKFNQQKRGRLGLKTIESLKKRNELLIEAKRLGFETKVDREGRVYVKKARAVDKSNSNMAIDSKFVPLEKRSEKLRNLYNKIQGLSQKYGWDFQSFMPNVIVGADGKKMNNKQIANALKDLENGIPSKGANLILNDLEAMAESGVIEVRDGQNLIGLPIDEFFKELERVAEGDIDRVLGEEVETLPETDLVKWFEEIEAEQQFESEIYEEPITPETLPEGGVQPEAKKEVPKPVRPTAAKPAREAGRGAPPTEGGPKPTPTEEGEPRRLSGIKKGLVSKEVLEGVDLDRTGDKQLLMAGKQIIESGEVEPKLLIDKIIDEGRGVLSPAEVVALITYKADLDTKIEDLTAEIEQLEASGQEIGTKGVELKNLQVEQRNFEIAAVITAQQQSMSFRLRRWMLDRTYSLQQQIAQYKKANGGVISPEVLEQFEKMDAEIQELKKQIKEAEERKVDQEGQVAVENIIEDVKREDARTLTDEEIDAKVQKGVQEEINKIYEQLPAKRKSRADQAIAALERIQKRLRSKTYDASIGIPVAIIDMGITTIKKALKAGVAIEKAIELGIDKIKDALKGKPFNNEDKFRKDLLDGFKAEGVKTEKEVPETPTINEDGTITIPEKFLRDLVRKGINTIDGLTDAAFKELESQLPGLTKRQVRDAITQYGKTVNPSQDEVRQQLAAAKRLGRLISELEDLKSMSKTEFALKYFKKPTPSKITEAEKNLKKQINSLARDLKTDAQVLSQAKESAKKRIEELQRRLKEKDYASRPKPLVKADAELEILLGKKQALQDKFEEEKKKAELKNRTFGQHIEDIALEIFSGISRALVAGLDLSAAFVQGAFRVFTNPVMSAKAFAEGLRQFASPTRMERFMQRYKGTYNYSVARNSGLAISDVDGTLSAKEQIFVVQWANTIYDLIASVITLGHKPSAEFIKRINPLKASQRAFDGYMNYIRISSFEAEMAALKNMGYTPDSNPEVYKSAADFVNTATGRANMGPLEASSKWLSVIMFAPRKVASELKLYSPLAFLYYGYMPAPVRKRALIDFAKFSASVLVTHALVKAAIDTYGGDEEDYEDFWNSDSPNFLAFKIGDKRISFLGGIKSTIVFMSRLFGQDFVDQYGITTKFGERYGKKIDTKLDLTTQFLLGKASPGAGAIRDYLDKNPNYENDDEILQNLVVPMWIQDANELYKEDPIAVTAMFNMLAIIGANIRKVDMKQVQDQIIFKEKINKKEVKRVVKLTDAQKEEFQNIVKERAKIELAKIAPIVKKEKSGTKRAEYDKMAIDQAKKDAQEILEKRYIKLFRQFPIQEKEQEETKEKVKKKLK